MGGDGVGGGFGGRGVHTYWGNPPLKSLQ